MRIAKVNGVELEYEMSGSGEPVLLINPLVPGAFMPLLSEPILGSRYRMIRYNKRGWGGSTHTSPPVGMADHAADAAALLDYLDFPAVHVAGHSSGGTIALQLALDHPDRVQTLALLEPVLLGVPSAAAFLEKVKPALEAFGAGNAELAIALFLSAVSGLQWDACRKTFEGAAPGAVAQAIEDVDTFFGVELPALGSWTLTEAQTATISKPVLSVRGTETEPLFAEGAEFLGAWLPEVEEASVRGVGHLLHLQQAEPVARRMAAFFSRHAMPQEGRGSARRDDRAPAALA